MAAKKQTRNRPKTKTKTKTKTKARASKAKAKQPKAKQAPWKALAFYFDNVVPFQAMPSMDLDRALETGINMFQYEFHAEYRRLQQEAALALASGAIAEIVELATKKKLAGLGPAETKLLLQNIAAAGDVRYEGAGE